MSLNRSALGVDCDREIGRISRFIRAQVSAMRREGAVVGLSGGIDSAVAAELCLRALGKENVCALVLPEKESQSRSAGLALEHAAKMGLRADVIDITPTLEGFRTYRMRDEAIKGVIPGYAPGQKMKVSLPPGLLDHESFNIYQLSVRDDSGQVVSARLKKDSLRAILAATNTKQRTRMMHLYFRAERDNLLVCGTTNRTEYALGFFVKHGDGGVDIEPIAHLYKAQVYQLADRLGVIEAIKSRVPSPDTFSEEVSDEEFYFRIPYETLDMLLYAWENKIAAGEAGAALNLTEDQVDRAFRDFAAKSRISSHLKTMPPRLKPLRR
ncbi:MAG: NAD(+) synthase [Candidatus Aminicenantales bacterium]